MGGIVRHWEGIVRHWEGWGASVWSQIGSEPLQQLLAGSLQVARHIERDLAAEKGKTGRCCGVVCMRCTAQAAEEAVSKAQ